MKIWGKERVEEKETEEVGDETPLQSLISGSLLILTLFAQASAGIWNRRRIVHALIWGTEIEDIRTLDLVCTQCFEMSFPRGYLTYLTQWPIPLGH